MKFLAVALAVVASFATAAASDLVSIACNSTTYKPWISSPNVTQCTKDITPYKMFPAFLPNATTYALFCPSKACQQVVRNTLAVRPATGECYYTVQGTKVNFYETLVDDAVKVCNISVTTTPSTSTPAPTTATPVPTTTAPAPTTTAPSPTTTAPTPTTTAPSPTTTAPATTTTRPACG